VAQLTVEPGEAIRLRLEHALAAEEVNLASEDGRARTETLIEETLRSYEAEALSGQAPPLAAEQRAMVDTSCETSSSGWGRSPSGCWPTRSRRSG
jgi:hypothetical protein